MQNDQLVSSLKVLFIFHTNYLSDASYQINAKCIIEIRWPFIFCPGRVAKPVFKNFWAATVILKTSNRVKSLMG